MEGRHIQTPEKKDSVLGRPLTVHKPSATVVTRRMSSSVFCQMDASHTPSKGMHEASLATTPEKEAKGIVEVHGSEGSSGERGRQRRGKRAAGRAIAEERRRSISEEIGFGRNGKGQELGEPKVKGRGGADKPRPFRPGFIWEIGSRMEAKDFMNYWYAAKIVDIDDSDSTVLIHFDGWNQRYDEWVDMNSDRLRPLTRHSDRKKSQKSKPMYKVGENVYARWSDCRMYPAKVVSVNPNGSYEVMFDDGVKKTVQSINVDMKPPLSSIGSGTRPSESVGRRSTSSSISTPEGATGDVAVISEEKLKPKKKWKNCSVRIKRSLSLAAEKDDYSSTCKLRTFSAGNEHEKSVAETENPDGDVVTGFEQQLQQMEDDIDDLSVKRRLIHVKTVHGKPKKTSCPSVAVSSKKDERAQLKCPHANCNKVFRNMTLVQYHVKYYHPDEKLDQTSPNQNQSTTGKRRHSASGSGECTLPGSESTEHRLKVKRLKVTEAQCIAGGSDDNDAVGLAVSLPTCSVHLDLPLDVVLHPQSSMLITKKVDSHRRLRRTSIRRGLRTRNMNAKRKRRINKRSPTVVKKVINCVCRGNKETSPLIQCSVCLCWQHVQCLEDKDIKTHLANLYICQMCTSPAGLRESARYSFHQNWLVEGQLADFDCFPPESTYGTAGKAKIMKITHQLVADLIGVKEVIDSVDRCIQIAQEKREPEFGHWQKISEEERANKYERLDAAGVCAGPEHDQLETTLKNIQKYECIESAENPCMSQNNGSCSDKLLAETELTNGTDLKSTSNDNDQDVRETLDTETIRQKTKMDNEENIEKFDTESKDDSKPDGTNLKTEDAVNNVCPNQLWNYINQLQDGIEESMMTIEEQVTALESAEGNGSSGDDILRDMPRVKKTLHQLMNDLNKVQQMSFCW